MPLCPPLRWQAQVHALKHSKPDQSYVMEKRANPLQLSIIKRQLAQQDLLDLKLPMTSPKILCSTTLFKGKNACFQASNFLRLETLCPA
ncbi:hypothetical protein NDU88_001594 [Pleurodeles waltl]|uniref:Uncharacterized protein n=1 Tax=Pleurodeles waltl TaxID=8319 RepID=A0AAV7KRW0_PLEWA|nr:hypothetical protein NDU88_001594 [Pleurodeles waltl]